MSLLLQLPQRRIVATSLSSSSSSSSIPGSISSNHQSSSTSILQHQKLYHPNTSIQGSNTNTDSTAVITPSSLSSSSFSYNNRRDYFRQVEEIETENEDNDEEEALLIPKEVIMTTSTTIPTTSHQQQQQYSKQPIYVNIETMRMQISNIASKLQSRISIDTIRPLPVFLGLSPGTGNSGGLCFSPTAFTPPIRIHYNKNSHSMLDKSTPEKIKSRVSLNMSYFISNYALFAAMTAMIIALMHPSMVLFVGIVYLLWMAHEFLIQHPLIVFNVEIHNLLSIQQRFYFLFTMTSIVVIWKCLSPTIYFVTISSILIILHALLRDPKDVEAYVSSNGNKMMNGRYPDSDDDVENDIEGGGGGNLNATTESNGSTSMSNGATTTTSTSSPLMKSPTAEKRRITIQK